MIWAAILFSLIDTFLAVFLVLIGAHGGEEIQLLAPFVFIASVGATWIAWGVLRRRPQAMAWKWFLAVALTSASIAPGTLLAMISYGNFQERQSIRRASVQDVVDEPILAPDGHTIGVRLRFRYMTPDGKFGSPRPTMLTDDGSLFFYFLDSATKVDGVVSSPYSFEAGRTYTLEYELMPAIDAYCCGKHPCEPAWPPARLHVRIDETPFGNPDYGGRTERTNGAYDPVEMVRGATACH